MTSTLQSPRVLADGFACAESPRWHDGELYFSDMYGHEVIAVDLAGRSRAVAEIQDVPTGLGWLPDGRLLIATQKGRRILRLEADGALSVHADLNDDAVSNLKTCGSMPAGARMSGNSASTPRRC